MHLKKIILITLLINTQLLQAISFSHHDWEMVCDNTNTCRIVGYSTYYSVLPVSVLLTLKAGSKQQVKATVQLGSLGEEVDNVLATLPSTFKVNMLINNKSHGYVQINKDKLTAPLSKEQTTALLSSLKKSSSIVWKAQKHTWKLSDKGASAVLLKVDEFQKRLGTQTALYKTGNKKNNKILSSKAIPTIYAPKLSNDNEVKLTALQMKQLDKKLILDKEICFDADKLNDKITLFKLSNNKLLATKACWMAAYNAGSAYWVVNNKAPFKAKLVTTDANAYYLDNNNIATLSSIHKGRGIGDCFSYEKLVWNGTTFQKRSEGTTGQCRVIAAGGAWELPTFVSKLKIK